MSETGTVAPVVGQRVSAETTTATAQRVTVEVTAIDQETTEGWLVYGYRRQGRSRPRQTMYPRLYFVRR